MSNEHLNDLSEDELIQLIRDDREKNKHTPTVKQLLILGIEAFKQEQADKMSKFMAKHK